MKRNYDLLVENLKNRANPEGIILESSFSEELRRIPQKGVFLYIKRAMRGVEPAYTRNSIEAGKKVRQKLENELNEVSFEFQGSVMTNTHIKGYSDIDLLTICDKFYTFDRDGISSFVNQNQYSYSYTSSQIDTLREVLAGGGYTSALQDLRNLRMDTERTLNSHYSYVDSSKPKSIKVSLTNPKREVDVVIANWYKNANYYLSYSPELKGIKIFVKGKEDWQDKQLKPDFPFLSIKRINDKDGQVNGRLKKMIRFLKTVKADSTLSDIIKLTSFDFNAICYNIEDYLYMDCNYLELVFVVYQQLHKINTNKSYRYNLKSVDGHEYVFRKEDQVTEDTDKVDSLRKMLKEIEDIVDDIKNEGIKERIAV